MGNAQPPPPKKKFESKKPAAMIGRRRKRKEFGPDFALRMPTITPIAPIRLRLLKLNRIKDHLLLEEEFLQNWDIVSGQNAEMLENDEREEIEFIRGPCMRVCTLKEMLDDNHAIISSPLGDVYVPVMSFVDRDLIEPGCSVLSTYSRLMMMPINVVGVLPDDKMIELASIKMEKRPTESYADVGGLDEQIQELKESVELPLKSPQLYEDMGIPSPKGVLLYGPPGTGKTLLAKAVAHETSATFIRMVGSDLVVKELGEGAKRVRMLFKMAEEHAPSIIFIDEIDAVGTKRYDGAREGELEVQRTMLELLTQMDGFEKRSNVKVILATNRLESLDSALVRPGRIDRKIEMPLPDQVTLEKIFHVQTKRMNLAPGIEAKEYVSDKEEMSGADVKALCTDAGLRALRARRLQVTSEDFKPAKNEIMLRKQSNCPVGMYL